MARVTLENVSRRYPGGVNAVAHFNLGVEDGTFVVLVGPSGCGKTTTLRMIAGLEDPSSGEIRIGDRVVNQVAPKDRNIAMVFQNYALYPHMSVYQNLAFGLELRAGGWWRSLGERLWRSPHAERNAALRRGIPERVRKAAQQLGIEHLLRRRPGELSGGERQRVALGRALVREPDVFLFDEPLSNLDAQLRVGMRRELKQLHRRLGATMLYVTHDQTEALTLGDRIVVMREGRIEQQGSPAEVYDHPATMFVAGFLGTPPMNLVRGTVRSSGAGWEFCGGADGAALREPAPSALAASAGRAVALGVRAEDIQPGSGGWRGVVSHVELLGDTQWVHTELGAASPGRATEALVWKASRAERIVPGQAVELAVPAARRHWFDVESGKRIEI